MKTIKELNEKMWYRLLKIFYLLVSALVICIIFGVNYTSYRIDKNKSYISCDDGRKLNGETLKTKEVDLDMDFDSNKLIVNHLDLSRADYLCADPKNLTERHEPLAPEKIEELKQTYSKKLTDSDAKVLNDHLKTLEDKYKVTSVYNTEESLKSIRLSILYSLIYCVIFLVINRMFYYIALGKIFPPKK